jgi:hypothetical protein
MRRTSGLAGLLVLLSWAAVVPCGALKAESPSAGELRAEGLGGLQKALASYDEAVEALAKDKQKAMFSCIAAPTSDTSREALKAAVETAAATVDEVAGQRNATVSRLFWYTDLEHAKKSAAESGKPILSLRMLGKLTDEYSCANSRFFRTALYSNKEISNYLRDNFVLHWQSVRPAPRITIDFGDGRKLERTITGNSAHFVLDAQGRPLDVLPGLYGPKAFREWLEKSHEFASRLADVAEGQRGTWLTSYHQERLNETEESLRADLAAVAPQLLPQDVIGPQQANAPRSASPAPTAAQAAVRAEVKRAAEAPLVAALSTVPSEKALLAQEEELWQRMAARHGESAKLDESSVALIRKEKPVDPRAAGLRAVSKARIEDPILRVVRNFEQAMAIDTVKNEYTLHRTIHQWFIRGEAGADVNALNERVYEELFLTPSSDPWLGLAPKEVYTGLTCGGLTENAAGFSKRGAEAIP